MTKYLGLDIGPDIKYIYFNNKQIIEYDVIQPVPKALSTLLNTARDKLSVTHIYYINHEHTHPDDDNKLKQYRKLYNILETFWRDNEYTIDMTPYNIHKIGQYFIKPKYEDVKHITTEEDAQALWHPKRIVHKLKNTHKHTKDDDHLEEFAHLLAMVYHTQELQGLSLAEAVEDRDTDMGDRR